MCLVLFSFIYPVNETVIKVKPKLVWIFGNIEDIY